MAFSGSTVHEVVKFIRAIVTACQMKRNKYKRGCFNESALVILHFYTNLSMQVVRVGSGTVPKTASSSCHSYRIRQPECFGFHIGLGLKG